MPEVEKRQPISALEHLKKHTKVVADTGDFESLKEFEPEDGTTNPTLILQAIGDEKYKRVFDDAIESGKATKKEGDELIDEIALRLNVNFGCEILKIIPGVVSTEVDANLSFDKDASIERARRLIALYEERGINKDRVLIKMASTWEGCQAAKVLEAEGIKCNMTLLFSLPQAAAAAEANATLVSPFVGRILDWYVAKEGKEKFEDAEKDPGVLSVRKIYNYMKRYKYSTVVMGASFRNANEILALVGCDKLTISPKLLKELSEKMLISLDPVLSEENAETAKDVPEKMELTEAKFRWLLNEDQMATEKLSEGIRKFNADLESLKKLISERLEKKD